MGGECEKAALSFLGSYHFFRQDSLNQHRQIAERSVAVTPFTAIPPRIFACIQP